MLVWLAILVIGLLLVGLVAGLLVERPPTSRTGTAQLASHVRAVREALVTRMGTGAAALAVLLAGLGAVVLVCWPLGAVFKALEPTVDVPLFHFAAGRQGHPEWTRVNQAFTLMGNRAQVKVVCVLAAVALAAAWRRRGWWVPPVVIATAYASEKFGQHLLARVVDRGHPPTTMGTYPSGGVARLLAVYGIILYLVLASRPQAGRVPRLVLFTLLSLAAFVEGYTRVFLLKHWFTDVVAGWVYGSLLLGALVAATATFLAGRGRPAARPAHADLDRAA